MDADGIDQRVLLAYDSTDTNTVDLSWSPDGEKIYYREGPPREGELFSVSSDGTNREKIEYTVTE